MDIDLLSKMVKELILDNDNVPLPGLGTFVAEIVPATFSDKGYTINPPYRRLGFRSRPDEGTMLAELYASSNDVPLDVADRILREFISELKTVLHARKTIVFPGLGRLRATKENAVFFVADEDLDIDPEGFGLEPLSLKTHQETQEEVAAVVSELKEMIAPEPVAYVEPEPVVVDVEPVVVDVEPVPILSFESETEDSPAAPEDEAKEVKNKSSFWKLAGKVLLWSAAAIVAFLVLFTILSRTFPDLFDTLLYTEEELEIINR